MRVLQIELTAGRFLLSGLFFAGGLQKISDPTPAMMLLEGFGLSRVLVWPAVVFNFAAALLLVTGRFVVPVSRVLAIYCLATSAFHFIPSDGLQISIFIKNWAIAGGLLSLSVAESSLIASLRAEETRGNN